MSKSREFSPLQKLTTVLDADAAAGIRHEAIEVFPKFFAALMLELHALRAYDPLLPKEIGSVYVWTSYGAVKVSPKRAAT